MCGIAGFANINDSWDRYRLIRALGAEIDYRGGDAIGYVALNGKVRTDRMLGKWSDAPRCFIEQAARGCHIILHSRYTTSGNPKSVKHAHPFSIHRNSKPVLHGVHNGMIYNAEQSAKRNGRRFKVDSRELFELIADDKWGKVRKLQGYGAIAYANHNDPSRLFLGRISTEGQMCVFKTKSGGAVFGSTEDIVKDACKFAKIKLDYDWEVRVGDIYQLNEAGLAFTRLDKVELKPYVKPVTKVEPKWAAVVEEEESGEESLGSALGSFLFEHEDEDGVVEERDGDIVINGEYFQRWLADNSTRN